MRACFGEEDPEGPTYTTIMELGPQNQNRDGFFGGPNSIVRVYGPSGLAEKRPALMNAACFGEEEFV